MPDMVAGVWSRRQRKVAPALTAPPKSDTAVAPELSATEDDDDSAVT